MTTSKCLCCKLESLLKDTSKMRTPSNDTFCGAKSFTLMFIYMYTLIWVQSVFEKSQGIHNRSRVVPRYSKISVRLPLLDSLYIYI